jgi:hypothetical protein
MEPLIVVVFVILVGIALEATVATFRARRKHHMDFEEGP